MRVFKDVAASASFRVRTKVEALLNNTVGYSIDAVPGGVDPFV
jgi:hypothetical protein